VIIFNNWTKSNLYPSAIKTKFLINLKHVQVVILKIDQKFEY